LCDPQRQAPRQSELDPSTAKVSLAQQILRPVPSVQARLTTSLSAFPWWVLFIALSGVLLAYNFTVDATYKEIIRVISAGIGLTVTVTLIAYSISIVLGLMTALGQLSPNVLFRNAAMLYVQIIRGVPIIVQIFYVALVLIPVFAIPAINGVGDLLAGWRVLAAENALSMLTNRQVGFAIRGIAALAIAYGAFSSEIFRAGIQSIERGQIDAALAVGLSKFQAFRLVIFPQAVRRVLPPLGNDFIAMLKESSLVSVLGVDEITLLGRKHASASFRFAETYNTLAFLYLSMTLLLSLGVSFMEKRLKTSE